MFFEPFDIHRAAPVMFWMAIGFAWAMSLAVLIERTVFGLLDVRQRRLEERYLPQVRRAVAGDAAACRALAASPLRHRVAIAKMLILPLIDDRDAAHIAAVRSVAEAIALPAVAEDYLRSPLWWRRARALRGLGLVQSRNHTAAIIAALDDEHADVRAAALDALTDLRDPASLPAVVVRMHDASLPRGRRAAALVAFGTACEPFLLDLAEIDPPRRLDYARALAICGTERSRPVLCAWASDPRPEVRAAALEALGYRGLDETAARLAIDALESADVPVRAMAARALSGWTGAGDAASRLGPHLEDAWPVAVHAARSLRSMGEPGLAELRAATSRADVAGVLARQTLWQAGFQT